MQAGRQRGSAYVTLMCYDFPVCKMKKRLPATDGFMSMVYDNTCAPLCGKKSLPTVVAQNNSQSTGQEFGPG